MTAAEGNRPPRRFGATADEVLTGEESPNSTGQCAG